jgi:hypothetical protein
MTNKLVILLVSILLTTTLACRKSSTSDAPLSIDLGPTTGSNDGIDGIPNVRHGDESQFTTIVGRVFAETQDYRARPLQGIEVYAYIAGKKLTTQTALDGSFSLINVPVLSNNSSGSNLYLYFSKAGWLCGSDCTNSFYKSVVVKSSAADARASFQIDIGPIRMIEEQLQVTSNLIHAGNDLGNGWLSTNTTYGAAGTTQVDEIYLPNSANIITLTFNMPVDTNYSGTSFVDLLDPNGAAVSYTGSWDASGTQFTISPNSGYTFTADSDSSTLYLLKIVRAVRAYNGPTSYKEITNLNLYFNFWSSTKSALASQAPALAPKLDQSGSGPFSAYLIDSGSGARKVVKKGPAGNGSTAEIKSTTENNVYISWNGVSGATKYNIYYRNMKDNKTGEWTLSSNVVAGASTNLLPDGSYFTSLDLFTGIFNNGPDLNILSGGERYQLIVTAVGDNGDESPFNVASPLVLQDQFPPTVSSAAVGALAYSEPFNTYFKYSFNRKLDLTFSESMDTTGGASLAIANASGAVSSMSFASNSYGPYWTSLTNRKGEVAITYSVPSTSLLTNVIATNTSLRVTASEAGKFQVGDVITIIETTIPGDSESVTISAVNSFEGLLTVGALAKSHNSGTVIRLRNRGSLTYFLGALNLPAYAAARSVSLSTGEGAKFYPSQTVKFYINDEEGWATVSAAYTISSISGDTVTLTGPLAINLPSGSLMVDSNVVAGEIDARAIITGALNNEFRFDVTPAVTTLASDQFAAAPDAALDYIHVADSSGFNVSDVVEIKGSSNSDLLEAVVPAAATTLTLTAHSFKVGDKITFVGKRETRNLGSVAAAAATSLVLSSSMSSVTGDNITLTDPAVETYTSAAAASGSNTITVNSTSGLVAGQTLIITNKVTEEAPNNIVSINTNTITLSANLANAYAAGSIVTRAVITQSGITANANNTTTTLVISAGATDDLSTNTIVNLTRPSFSTTVTAIATDSITVTPAIGTNGFPLGASVELDNYPEIKTILAVAFRSLRFTSGLSYSHRSGVQVIRFPQATAKLTSWPSNNIVVGDTVVLRTNSSLTNDGDAATDRIEATIANVDSANNLVQMTTTTTGIVQTTIRALTFMGDSAIITGANDSNGNPLQNLNRVVNLNNGTVK